MRARSSGGRAEEQPIPSDRVTVFTSYFEDMPDPQVNRARLHRLSGIILSTLIGMLAGADDWVHIEWCGQMGLRKDRPLGDDISRRPGREDAIGPDRERRFIGGLEGL